MVGGHEQEGRKREDERCERGGNGENRKREKGVCGLSPVVPHGAFLPNIPQSHNTDRKMDG